MAANHLAEALEQRGELGGGPLSGWDVEDRPGLHAENPRDPLVVMRSYPPRPEVMTANFSETAAI